MTEGEAPRPHAPYRWDDMNPPVRERLRDKEPAAMSVPDTKKTPLHDVHDDLGATVTEFAGYLMPLRYGSETAEHQAVRTSAGLFDLSHMGEIFLTGPQAGAALDHALIGHLSALTAGHRTPRRTGCSAGNRGRGCPS